MALKFCPIKGCWRLQTVRVEYNWFTGMCCSKHIEEVERMARNAMEIDNLLKQISILKSRRDKLKRIKNGPDKR